MQYTYTVLEAAAMWLDLDPLPILERMAKTDMSIAEAKRDAAIAKCKACPDQPSCPQWYDDTSITCPEGYSHVPSADASHYLHDTKRYVPLTGEFPEHPELAERVRLLQSAIECGDLPGHDGAISHIDLRQWLERYDPLQKPSFLYGQNEVIRASDDKIFAIIGALLSELEARRMNQTAACAMVAEKLAGHRGFSTRNLDDVFAKARAEFRKRFDATNIAHNKSKA